MHPDRMEYYRTAFLACFRNDDEGALNELLDELEEELDDERIARLTASAD